MSNLEWVWLNLFLVFHACYEEGKYGDSSPDPPLFKVIYSRRVGVDFVLYAAFYEMVPKNRGSPPIPRTSRIVPNMEG